MVPLTDLRPWEANYRHHPAEQLDRIRESLRRNGQRKAVVVQASTMRIVAGHGVAEAMRLEGYTEARCDVWDCSDEQAAAYLVDDNELSRHAVDDEAQLAALLLELQDTQFAPVSFNEAEIAFLAADGLQWQAAAAVELIGDDNADNSGGSGRVYRGPLNGVIVTVGEYGTAMVAIELMAQVRDVLTELYGADARTGILGLMEDIASGALHR